jgi:3-oxoacyl-[acyl-carrier-protein] synthase II
LSFLGHLRAHRLSTSAPLPLDARRSGFALAEGAALLMLEEGTAAAARGATVLAEVQGHGAAFDPAGSEAGAAQAVARAVRIALADAGIGPGEIDAVSLSANGSPTGDRAEAAGLAAALGNGAAGLPVTAIKSMLGEALGASGGFQAVALLGTFREGSLPGVLGLAATEAGFPLTGAAAGTRRVAVRRALLTALGADGHACAVILGTN